MGFKVCAQKIELKLLARYAAGLVITSFDLGGAVHTYFAIKLTELSGFWHVNCVTVLQCFEPLDDVGLKPCVVLLMFYKFYDPFNKRKEPISRPHSIVCMYFPTRHPQMHCSLLGALEPINLTLNSRLQEKGLGNQGKLAGTKIC